MKLTMKRLGTILLLCAACMGTVSPARAEDVVPLKTTDAALEVTEQIMNKVSEGDLENAIRAMRPYFRIPDAEFNILLEQSKMQIPAISSRFGTPLEHELIERRFVGKSLMMIVHLQKYTFHAMRWEFLFYNPDGSWYINSFNFDDKIKELF
ncbi:MAG: hypothetical protein KA342_07165 [Aminivibrio sp.]|jgi:hypothetical protein|nr:hypothetical protein [Aminivibrio sp.]